MAAIAVQRGSATLAGGTATSTITLGTQVAQANSFVIASIKGGNSAQSDEMVTVALATVSGSNWTQLVITRQTTTGSVTIEWQVITSTDFAVQRGSATFANSATLDVTVTAVDSTKAFLVFTANYAAAQNDDNGRTAPFSGRFTSTTNIRFEKQFADASRIPTIQWYVVEWTGATVQTGGVTIAAAASSNTATITSVTTTKSFVLHSYHQTDATNQGAATDTLVRAELTNATTATFTRSGTSTAKQIYYFVVSHPSISVQSGTIAATAGNASNTATISSIDTTTSFLAYGSIFGNTSSSDTTVDNQYNSWSTQTLTNATTVTAASNGTSGTRTSAYSVVTYAPSTTNSGFLAFM